MLSKKIASTIAPTVIECKACGADVEVNVNKKNQRCPKCGALITTNSSTE